MCCSLMAMQNLLSEEAASLSLYNVQDMGNLTPTLHSQGRKKCDFFCLLPEANIF